MSCRRFYFTSTLLVPLFAALVGLSACNYDNQPFNPHEIESNNVVALEYVSHEFEIDKSEDKVIYDSIDTCIGEHYDLGECTTCISPNADDATPDNHVTEEDCIWASWHPPPGLTNDCLVFEGNFSGYHDPPQNSEFIFVTNNTQSSGRFLIREGDEFMGFTLEKIYKSIIEIFGGQPGMQRSAYAVLTGGSLIATGDIVVWRNAFDDCELSDSFIFYSHESYFSLFPALVGDRTAEDAPFNIINTHDVVNHFGLVEPDPDSERIIIEGVTVRFTDITLSGRRMGCPSHSAVIEILCNETIGIDSP